MTTATFNTVRREFEAWCAEHGYDLSRTSSGDYASADTREKWATWCAAKGYGS